MIVASVICPAPRLSLDLYDVRSTRTWKVASAPKLENVEERIDPPPCRVAGSPLLLLYMKPRCT